MSQDESRFSAAHHHTQDQVRPLPSDEELRVYVITHLDDALKNDWVRPFYQPVVRTLTGKLCGTEALARWEDPTYGLLTPDKFIPALEEARIVHLLDCHIVKAVCRQYRESCDRGVPVVPISFNLSRLDFDLCDIFNVVEDAVREFEVPRNMLNIEITETVFGTDPAFMASMVGRFHDVGYQVWMDDFGSGYSTLNALKDFDFDELKLDMEFLNSFGEKSKTILASVVDMAKKLGIQTLAEGVENEEHRRYLRRIGCEKMQGYLFGKPMPYSEEDTDSLTRAIGVESRTERLYFEKIGSVNTLSLSERDLTAGSNTRGYVTSMSLAIVEYNDDRFKVLDSNRVFRESLENIGVLSIDEAEERINDTGRQLARQARHLVETIARDKYARIDFVVSDIACAMRAKFITSQAGRTAVLVSVDDTIVQGERHRHDRMHDALSVMYSIYEHVDILHLDEGYSEPVFGNAGRHIRYDAPTIDDITREFASSDIYPADRERFIAYLEQDTIIERIEKGGETYLVDFFRMRQKGGDFTWKIVALIRLDDQPDSQVMLCIRGTHWTNDGLFQAAYDGRADEQLDSIDADFSLTDGGLWRAIARDESMCLFWKDRDRKFVGANRAFLDYYGFDSVAYIAGKTDEDMGWHIDPVPFLEDELRVLNEGESISHVPGHCIVKGEVRDILATKRPVYRNGRIVGLVGYFVDADDELLGSREMGSLPLRDPVTGLLNFTGLESATWRFVDSYKRSGIDFAMISINIESFQQINDELGYEFGDKVLARIGEELRNAAGSRCAIGHVYADRFVILAQSATDEQLQELCDEVERRLMAIVEVDGAPCTVYALAGFARYSEIQDVEAMKRHNRNRHAKRRDDSEGMPSQGDVITSTLL
ncbi:MAG: EAL domain-containing protein [Eggerthellaceae bacterium]|nr:EAL domain-containing protein [Eggerthellaceae bacterium]